MRSEGANYGIHATTSTADNAITYGIYGKAGLVENNGTSYGVYADTGVGGGGGAGTVHGIYAINNALTLTGRAGYFKDGDSTATTVPTVEIASRSADSGLVISQAASGFGLNVQGSARFDPNNLGGNNENTVDVYGSDDGSSTGSALYVEQTDGHQYGIYSSGVAPGYYVLPSTIPDPGNYAAITGSANSNTLPNKNRYGVLGTASSVNGGGEISAGVRGIAGSTASGGGVTYGVYGSSSSNHTTGTSYAIYGLSENARGIGVYARNTSGYALQSEGQSFFNAPGSDTVTISGTENVLQVYPTTGDGIRINSADANTNSVFATGNIKTTESVHASDLWLKNDADSSQGSFQTFIRTYPTADPQICVAGVGSCSSQDLECYSSIEFSIGPQPDITACKSACLNLTPSDYNCQFDCNGEAYPQCTDATRITGQNQCSSYDYSWLELGECNCRFEGPSGGQYTQEEFTPNQTACVELTIKQIVP